MSQLKKNLYNILERKDVKPRLSFFINKFLILLIFFNVSVATIETVPNLHKNYLAFFWTVELVSIVVFSAEYLLRYWISSENKALKGRFSYLFSSDSVINFLSIAPFYLSLFSTLDLKILIMLRLFRLLKLIRYFEPLSILGRALRSEFTSFISAFFILFLLIMFAATGMYVFEKEAQPELFNSIPKAMWWAVVTLTTLGYGDVVPMTVMGKLFAGVVTILSIGTVALPTGILASRFAEELKTRKKKFQTLAMSLQKNGHLCTKSKKILEGRRREACLSKKEAKSLMKLACQQGVGVCPYCGQSKSKPIQIEESV